jgi:hypothetical protein
VSSLQPPTSVALVSPDWHGYPSSGIALLSRLHVLYNPPPSISLAPGGFGFSVCCRTFGSGLGVGVPVGQPTPAEISDQFVSSSLIPSPPDVANGANTTWSLDRWPGFECCGASCRRLRSASFHCSNAQTRDQVRDGDMWRGSSKVAVVVLAGSALFSACGDSAQLPLSAGFGPDPQLPPPNVTLLPTVNIAPAVGWHAGEQPTPAPGLAITAFAMGLNHPRNVYVLPNGGRNQRSAETR